MDSGPHPDSTGQTHALPHAAGWDRSPKMITRVPSSSVFRFCACDQVPEFHVGGEDVVGWRSRLLRARS